MALGIEKITKEITESKKRATINKAIQHQNRIKFHAQTNLTPVINQPLTEFLNFVGSLIPKDKFRTFKSLFRYPVKSNEVTGICFDKLSRVFDGRNPAFNFQFLNTEQRDDWEYYRQDVLKEPAVWQTKGWEFFKTEINSVLIIDLPTEQDATDKYPQPYFYWLTIDSVLAYKANPTTGIMDWIIFRQPDNKIAVFDKEHYEVYNYDNTKRVLGDLVTSNAHDLGYCPARFFWNEPLSLSDPDIKEHPLTKQLESLDWFLFFHISKKHLDLFGAYPIYSGYEQQCDFSNDETGHTCDGGFMKDAKGSYILDSAGLLNRCPKCGDKRIAGAGSFIEVPIPQEDQPDLKNPVQMLTVDVQSLEYNVKEENRLKNNIVTATVGVDSEVISSQALNEKQVEANFESQSAILNRVKKGFEDAMQFVDETICKLRYGNSFISGKINLGTEFYTLNSTELRQRYQTAKTSGASEAELDAMQNQIIETEYRHNPTQLQRMYILSELEPYRHLTRAEILELHGKGLITNEELRIKLNFVSFVKRFERENTNILEFGTAIPFDKKIDIINQTIKQYASENSGGD